MTSLWEPGVLMGPISHNWGVMPCIAMVQDAEPSSHLKELAQCYRHLQVRKHRREDLRLQPKPHSCL